MNLNSVTRRTNRTMPSKRLGRGVASGVGGHTVGRGSKGQKSRAGHKSMMLFEGGNRPFYSRMPKLKGFKTVEKIEYQPINLDIIEENYKASETVNLDTLREKGLIRKKTMHVKVLGNGELTKAVTVAGLKISKKAEEAITKNKGKIE